MTAYREILYRKYHSTQENRQGENEAVLFDQQVYYFSKEIVPLLPSDKHVKILEIGCGNGSLIKTMLNADFKDITGIDLSQEQVDVARKLGVAQAHCISAVDYLNGKREVFDVILAIDVIEHFTKNEIVNFLEMALAALKPGGMVIFRTPNMDAPLTSLYSYGDFTHECLLNKSSALQLMKSTGFSEADVLPSMIHVQGVLKEALRKIIWSLTLLSIKAMLFASGRTWKDAVFTPNLIIIGKK
jgi:SAM-dependent methyltransferase